ncbi:hypothetical protein QZH41_001610 [Actinostola sp. cb2023]|nr:hypothetical protein QZH41_001610 [Actinostola sp. cb2023]
MAGQDIEETEVVAILHLAEGRTARQPPPSYSGRSGNSHDDKSYGAPRNRYNDEDRYNYKREPRMRRRERSPEMDR